MNSSRAYMVWAVALAAYVLAQFNRSSLSVAGLMAAERYSLGPAQLSFFVMLQLIIYVALQLPAGIAADRRGPRATILLGTALMMGGQVIFALADTYGGALLARSLVGSGDAFIFVSVLHLIASWFGPDTIPWMNQLTGLVAQVGVVAAAAPTTFALRALGWSLTYGLAASLSLVVGGAVALLIRDRPQGTGETRSAPQVQPRIGTSVLSVIGDPGTQLGFWTHFTASFSSITLILVWGFPYFVLGQGLNEQAAGLLVSVMAMSVMVGAVLFGQMSKRLPHYRYVVVISVVATLISVWVAVLAWPGSPPTGVLAVFAFIVGASTPASLIGFDFCRESVPAHLLGVATSLVNVGGFVGALVTIGGIGLVLELRSAGSVRTPPDLRAAMAIHLVVLIVGLVMIARAKRRQKPSPRPMLDHEGTSL